MSLAAFSARVPEIAVNGLNKYSGQFVSLYYVSGKTASFGTTGQDLDINRVLKGPVTQKISGDQISFNATDVKSNGFAAFNYVLAVVHAQPDHFVTNLRLKSGNVVRIPVATSGKAIGDSKENRRFNSKRFKAFFKLRKNPSLKFQ
jgi:hypothetical protein